MIICDQSIRGSVGLRNVHVIEKSLQWKIVEGNRTMRRAEYRKNTLAKT